MSAFTTRVLPVLLAIMFVFTSALGSFVFPASFTPADDGFTPVLRFIACSDVHITYPGDFRSQRFVKAVKTGYAYAAADSEYNKLDAVLVAGDITDKGLLSEYLSFQSIVDRYIKDETKDVVIVAKSHDCKTYGKNALSVYSALSGNDTDFNYTINGCHFIGISTSPESEEALYTDEQLSRLREQIAAAALEDPSKPIFVTHHEHVSGTVYGSEGWGYKGFYDILDDYPQVVDFSGHSHYPVNDPRSIWQGDFTALGTGSLHYTEFDIDGEFSIHPSGSKRVANMWIVEVDAQSRVLLKGYDLIADEFICEYLIDAPSDKSSFEYTEAKRIAASSAPAFASGAAVKTGRSIDGKYEFTVPAAESTDGNIVFLYRAFVLDAQGNAVSDSFELSGYYFTPTPDKVTVKLKDKLPAGTYTVNVTAENAYGMRSAPINTQITVR